MITAASVFFAVFFALIMRSLQTGSYDYMYKNVIESYSGYIQIQGEKWWDEKTIDNSFAFTPEIESWLKSDENVREVIPRLESFALASGGTATKGAMVMGIDPEKENLLSDITSKLAKYHLSAEAIEQLEKETELPEKSRELLQLYEDSYFSSDERILRDLGLDEENAGAYIPILE
jgi:ABC-type lipoprotein release transport system permease subunit